VSSTTAVFYSIFHGGCRPDVFGAYPQDQTIEPWLDDDHNLGGVQDDFIGSDSIFITAFRPNQQKK
ncbi:MAG: hypothetical protein ABJA76_09085, partial [Mucilaginibacter sp.]